MTSHKKLRAGVIGCGQIGSYFDEAAPTLEFVKTHAGAYAGSQSFELVALYDSDTKRAEQAKQFWKTPKVLHSIQDVDKEDLDVVSVCTPSAFHLEIITELVKKNTPLIFCEKPLCLNMGEIERLQSLTRETSTKIMVNYIRRYDDEMIKLRAAIADGEYGDLQKIVCHYGKGLRNNGSHAINLLLFLFGPAQSVQFLNTLPDDRKGSSDETKDCVLYFSTRHDGLRPAYMTAQDHQFYTEFEVDIFLEKRRITIRKGGRIVEFYTAKSDSQFSGYQTLELERRIEGGLRHTYKNALREAESILYRNLDEPSSGLADTYLTEKTIAAILSSEKSRGEKTNV